MLDRAGWRGLAGAAALVALAVLTARGDEPVSPGVSPEVASAAQPGATVLARERDAWTLEGRLVAEAHALLSSPRARAELGDPAALAAAGGEGEARVRAWLRGQRAREQRDLARSFVDGLDRPTRELLDRAGRAAGAAREDVFMDYLTYDGLYDLALMRYGWRRWREGRSAGAAKALGDGFFTAVGQLPSAAAGISVAAVGSASLEVNVFGARVLAEVLDSRVEHVPGVGPVGKVEWRSGYEGLRAAARGQAATATLTDVLPLEEGRYRVSYALEVDDYLVEGAGRPWATLLYLTSADEVADLYAGVAAAGGLEAVAPVGAADPATLPTEGLIGTKERGLALRVVEVRSTPALGAARTRRGKFALVVLEARSTLATEVKAPSDWFVLEAAGAEYPEVGVTRPGLAATALAVVEAPGARLLGLPCTRLAPGAATTLVLVFELPRDVKVAALRIGAREAALKVQLP